MGEGGGRGSGSSSCQTHMKPLYLSVIVIRFGS